MAKKEKKKQIILWKTTEQIDVWTAEAFGDVEQNKINHFWIVQTYNKE